MASQHESKWLKIAGATVATIVAAVALAGCASGPGKGENKQDPKAQVVVWGDANRQPAFDAYKKAHPDVNLKYEVIDSGTYLSKIQLANRVGKGWPDVIFDPQPNDVAALQSSLFNYAQDLKGLVPQDVQKNFATENAICTIGGGLYCLQNDLAQDVIWYNKPLLEKFGYTIPTTWADYKALGDKIVVEHPGYLIGASGGGIYNDYLWPSGCPLQDVKSAAAVVINTKSEKCTRVVDMLDDLIPKGAISKYGMFDPAFSKAAQDGKLLMLVGPSWMGQYVFKPKTGYAFPDGAVAVAAMPSWPGEQTNWSGATGGGVYVVSRHSKNLQGAVAAAQFAATDLGYQTTAGTYPAYKPAAAAWLKSLASDKFYAENPAQVLADQASKINPSTVATRYDASAAVGNTLATTVQQGGTVASAMPNLQYQLSSLAASAGYEVREN